MAIEDLIWAKNRHMFGGIEPPDVLDFTVTQFYDYEKGKYVIQLYLVMPDDLVIPGELNSSGYDSSICTVGGVMIRKSTTGYPKDEFDGELLADIPIDGSLKEVHMTDENTTEDETYYYKTFVYSTQGIYRASVERKIKSNAAYFYGYDLDTTNSDPEARVMYPSDVYNYGFTPATLNNLNDWNIEPGTKFMPRPCMLKYDGTVGEYLNPNDYSKTVDGADSNVANTSYEGNAMMEWSKIYTKRWEENGIYHFRCSDVKIDDDYECWCNYDANGAEIDYFYTGIYYCSTYVETGMYKFRSCSATSPTTDITMQSAADRAVANGEGWNMELIRDRLLIQDLLVMLGKSTNTQEVFGYGLGTKYGPPTGGWNNDKGLFYGAHDNDTALKIFGMENYWGNLGSPIYDAFIRYGNLYIRTKTSDISNYIDCGTITSSSYYSIGYISGMNTYSFGRIPVGYTKLDGSATTYECDEAYIPNKYDETCYIVMGGGIGSSTNDPNPNGAFNYNFGLYPDSAHTNISSRLSCKPLKV